MKRDHRITVHVTRDESVRLAKCAERRGLSLSEFMRRAALEFPGTNEEQAQTTPTNAVIDATERAERAIDDSLEYVARSNERIERMTARARQHK